MAELLRLEGVSLEGSDGRMVFQNLNWSLPPGGRVRLHAPSGAGTSALLRLCAGLADPQEGRVLLDEVSLSSHAFAHPFLKEGGIGWVPRDKGLLDNLSLWANVALPLRFLRGHTRVELLKAKPNRLLWGKTTEKEKAAAQRRVDEARRGDTGK